MSAGAGAAREARGRLPLPTPQVVVFDLDYTLLRPSDQFEAPGYVRTGARFGLAPGPGALAAGGARRLRRRRGAPRGRPASSTTTACCR